MSSRNSTCVIVMTSIGCRRCRCRSPTLIDAATAFTFIVAIAMALSTASPLRHRVSAQRLTSAEIVAYPQGRSSYKYATLPGFFDFPRGNRKIFLHSRVAFDSFYCLSPEELCLSPTRRGQSSFLCTRMPMRKHPGADVKVPGYKDKSTRVPYLSVPGYFGVSTRVLSSWNPGTFKGASPTFAIGIGKRLITGVALLIASPVDKFVVLHFIPERTRPCGRTVR